MKKLFAMVALAIPMLAAPIVTYTTTGTFSGGSTSGTNVYTAPTGTLTFLMGTGSYDLGAINPTNVTLGTIDSNAFSSVSALSGNFTLTINQTSPFAGSGSATGVLSGKIVVDASSARLYFASPTVTLNGPGTVQTAYTVIEPSNGIAIVSPSSHPGGAVTGATTIQGELSISGATNQTPEPATMGLMGLGLLAVGLVARRRSA